MANLNVVIGMGGTGGRIISEIRRIETQKKYYIDAYSKKKGDPGDNFYSGFRYLYYDTNDDMLTSTDIWESSYGSFELDRDREWLQADRELLNRINTGDNSFGSTWLSDRGDISFSKAADAKGAEQRRRLGRILFASVKHKFDERLDSLLNNSGSDDRIVIHLVGSPAGGTGGGSLLDALAILSERVNRIKAEIRLYIATPEDAPRGYTTDKPFYSNIYQFYADLNEILSEDKNWYTLGARVKGSGLYPRFRSEPVSVFVATDTSIRNTRFDFSKTKQERNSSGVYETTYSASIEGKIAEFILCNAINFKRDRNSSASDKFPTKKFLGWTEFYTFGIESISSGESLKRENFAALIAENIVNKLVSSRHDSTNFGYTFQDSPRKSVGCPTTDEVRQQGLELLKAASMTPDAFLFRRSCEPLEADEAISESLSKFVAGSLPKYLGFLKEEGFQEAQNAIYKDVMLYVKSKYKERGFNNHLRDLTSRLPRLRKQFLRLFKEALLTKARQPDNFGGLENVATYFDSAIEQFSANFSRQFDEVERQLLTRIEELKLSRDRFTKRVQGRLLGGALVTASKKKNELDEFKDLTVSLTISQFELDEILAFARVLTAELVEELQSYRESDFSKFLTILRGSAEYFTSRREVVDQSFVNSYDQSLKSEFKDYENFKREFCEQKNLDLAIQSKVDQLLRDIQFGNIQIDRGILNSRVRELARECIEEVSRKNSEIFNPDALKLLKRMDKRDRLSLIAAKVSGASPLARIDDKLIEVDSRSKFVIVPRTSGTETETFMKGDFKQELPENWGDKLSNQNGELDDRLKDIYFIEIVSDLPIQAFRAVGDRFGPSFYSHTLHGFGKEAEIVRERRFDTAVDPLWYRCRPICGNFDSDTLDDVYHTLIFAWAFVAHSVGVLENLLVDDRDLTFREGSRSFRKAEGNDVLSDNEGISVVNLRCKGLMGLLEVIESSHRQSSSPFPIWTDDGGIVQPAEFSTGHADFNRLNLLIRLQTASLGQLAFFRNSTDSGDHLSNSLSRQKHLEIWLRDVFINRFDNNRKRKLESALEYASLIVRREADAGC